MADFGDNLAKNDWRRIFLPTLDWTGKAEAICAAQNIPYRLLDTDAALSCGSENLIVQGDNLEALNSLLPFYRGRVKCVYIRSAL